MPNQQNTSPFHNTSESISGLGSVATTEASSTISIASHASARSSRPHRRACHASKPNTASTAA